MGINHPMFGSAFGQDPEDLPTPAEYRREQKDKAVDIMYGALERLADAEADGLKPQEVARIAKMALDAADTLLYPKGV